MATFTDDVITKLSMFDGLSALAGGFRQVLNSAPPKMCLAVLGAQSVLETGRFQKMHCNNAGNRKMPPAWDGLFTRFKCDEIFDPATAARAKQLGPCSVAPWKDGPNMRVVLVPPHPWSAFVAFPTAAQGMADHLQLLACNDCYRAAWSKAYAGDARGFAVALHGAGYFTADLEPYASGVASLALELSPMCQAVIGDSPFSDDDVAHIDALISRTMAEARWGAPEQFPLEDA